MIESKISNRNRKRRSRIKKGLRKPERVLLA
jgi:hypothetical protein